MGNEMRLLSNKSFSCRAHGFRFDHLSFVANQRRSEKARNFLDLLRHSQLYEVFINERLALAAAEYKTSDAFEAKVEYMLSKKGKVLGRLVAQASARGVSNLSAVLQRTSTLVKVFPFARSSHGALKSSNLELQSICKLLFQKICDVAHISSVQGCSHMLSYLVCVCKDLPSWT